MFHCRDISYVFLYQIFRPFIFIDAIKNVTVFITYTHLFYKNNFIRTKALVLAQKIKNKLRTKPGLLSRRT